MAGPISYDLGFERSIMYLEVQLSIAAAVPVVGMISSIVRLALGIIQMVGAALVMIALAIPALFNETARALFFRASAHFVNGSANVAVSLLEAIPFVGTAIFFTRTVRDQNIDEVPACAHKTGQEYAFIGFELLERYPAHCIHLNHCGHDDLQGDCEVYNDTVERRQSDEFYRVVPWYLF